LAAQKHDWFRNSNPFSNIHFQLTRKKEKKEKKLFSNVGFVRGPSMAAAAAAA
jgi:hypothetical protein